MQDKIIAGFVGCSFTVGEGFPVEQRDQYIYDRLVAKHYGFTSKNLARGGWGNYEIFMRSSQAIISEVYDFVFVQWSELNRIWLSPGPDLWLPSNDDSPTGFRGNNIYLTPKERSFFRDTLTVLNHDYQNILDLIDYVAILNRLGEHASTHVIHINGLLPWAADLDQPLDRSNLENFFSTYTKQLLDFDNNPDDKVCAEFSRLQTKFATLDKSRWVNVFDPFSSYMVDIGPEGHHPGVKSHRLMADKIINYLDKEVL